MLGHQFMLHLVLFYRVITAGAEVNVMIFSLHLRLIPLIEGLLFKRARALIIPLIRQLLVVVFVAHRGCTQFTVEDSLLRMRSRELAFISCGETRVLLARRSKERLYLIEIARID